MIVSINQPAYLPWLGYCDRIAASDVHVVLDNVQFEKNSFTNRNRIRAQQGATWLTIPLATSGQFGDLPIRSLRAADGGRWRKKHLASIRANYARSSQFSEHFPALESLFAVNHPNDLLFPLVHSITEYHLRTLGITTPQVLSSTMELKARKSDLVLEICRKVGASVYLSGPFGRDYLDLRQFDAAGIAVKFHDYAPCPYPQVWPGFVSHLAALDAILTLSAQEARQVMEAGRRVNDFQPSGG